MYDWDVQEQLVKLRILMDRQQKELAELEDEVGKIRRQLEPIEARYNRVVKPIADRFLAMRDAVREAEALRRKQAKGAPTPLETLWDDYWRKPPRFTPNAAEPEREFTIPTKRPNASDDIKKIYRRLAMRFHPDLADDGADMIQRNNIMSRINEAYKERNLEALLVFDETQDEDELNQENLAALPVSVLKLRRLKAESAEMAQRIQELKIEKFDLTHSVLFDLKIQEKWDKRDGRNILQEMADFFEREYSRLSLRLQELRRTLD